MPKYPPIPPLQIPSIRPSVTVGSPMRLQPHRGWGGHLLACQRIWWNRLRFQYEHWSNILETKLKQDTSPFCPYPWPMTCPYLDLLMVPTAQHGLVLVLLAGCHSLWRSVCAPYMTPLKISAPSNSSTQKYNFTFYCLYYRKNNWLFLPLYKHLIPVTYKICSTCTFPPPPPQIVPLR